MKIERGKRLTDVRNLLRMKRLEFSDFLAISQYTIRSWEQGQYGGLTEKGAMAIREKIMEKGLYFHEDWLMNGTGKFPIFLDAEEQQQTLQNKDKILIQKESHEFQKNYPNHLILEISDLNMSPFFEVGDLIGGVIISPDHYATAIKMLCIFQPNEETILYRQFVENIHGHYIFQHPITHQQEIYPSILKLAPMLWLRRPRFA